MPLPTLSVQFRSKEYYSQKWTEHFPLSNKILTTWHRPQVHIFGGKSMNAIHVNVTELSEFLGLDVHFIEQKTYICLAASFFLYVFHSISPRWAFKDWPISSGPSPIRHPSPTHPCFPFHQETKGNNGNLKLRDCATGCKAGGCRCKLSSCRLDGHPGKVRIASG